MATDSRVIVALDFSNTRLAMDFVEKVEPELCRLKVGKELFTRAGPQFVETLIQKGFDVFLDLKFHDIPNTVAAASRAVCDLGVWMFNVHALGGREMLEAAKETIDKVTYKPLLIAVTILTSMNEAALREVGLMNTPKEHVLQLAILTADTGLDGVVCSAQEVSLLREKIGHQFSLITPGIRPANAALGDQKRVMTPAQAIANGANYLVVGRPITQAEEPLQVLEQIQQEITSLP